MSAGEYLAVRATRRLSTTECPVDSSSMVAIRERSHVEIRLNNLKLSSHYAMFYHCGPYQEFTQILDNEPNGCFGCCSNGSSLSSTAQRRRMTKYCPPAGDSMRKWLPSCLRGTSTDIRIISTIESGPEKAPMRKYDSPTIKKRYFIF